MADVSISSPGAGRSFSGTSGSVTIDLEWVDSGAVPLLDDVNTFTFLLCTGPNNNVNCFSQLALEVPAADLLDNSYTATFLNTVCANGLFYIQITAVTTDGYTLHYTNRFTLNGMTGTRRLTGSGSPPQGQTLLQGGPTIAPIDPRSWTLHYTQQTGSTRYAPMQTQPGTTVTATSWSRRFPTSAVTYYSTVRHSPNVYSTTTLPWTYTMESLINQATPAPNPSVLGWYPASERIQSASLSTYADSDVQKKRKRWDID